jgi:hypothetical protein
LTPKSFYQELGSCVTHFLAQPGTLGVVNAHSKSSVKMELLEKKITTTHRVREHELLKRLEHFCKRAGLEFPTDAWPKDDRKAHFLLGA